MNIIVFTSVSTGYIYIYWNPIHNNIKIHKTYEGFENSPAGYSFLLFFAPYNKAHTQYIEWAFCTPGRCGEKREKKSN